MVFDLSLVKIQRSVKRKSASIHIYANNDVRLIVPKHFSYYKIKSILLAKSKWINRKIKFNLFHTVPYLNQKYYKNGSILYFLGQSYKLSLIPASSLNISLNSFNFNLCLPEFTQSVIRSSLMEWFAHQAQDIILKKVKYFSLKMQVSPNKIRFKNLRSRWGSCSSLGNLNFNWNIIMAPEEVVDYLVVHECAHLRFMNHSKYFWLFVEQHCPSFKSSVEWLKVNGSRLKI